MVGVSVIVRLGAIVSVNDAVEVGVAVSVRVGVHVGEASEVQLWVMFLLQKVTWRQSAKSQFQVH